MTLTEFIEQLEQADEAFGRLAANDPQRFQLSNQISQLKKEMVTKAFDVDADMSAITVADQKALRELTAKAAAATDASQVPSGTLGKILGITRIVLPALGVRLPV